MCALVSQRHKRVIEVDGAKGRLQSARAALLGPAILVCTDLAAASTAAAAATTGSFTYK